MQLGFGFFFLGVLLKKKNHLLTTCISKIYKGKQTILPLLKINTIESLSYVFIIQVRETFEKILGLGLVFLEGGGVCWLFFLCFSICDDSKQVKLLKS